MTLKTKCEYTRPPRPAQAKGSAVIIFPIVVLTGLLVRRLAERALSCLERPLHDEDYREAQTRVGLSEDTLNLTTPLDQSSIEELDWNGHQKGLRALSVLAEQLSSGTAADDAVDDDLNELQRLCHSELTTRFRQFISHLQQTEGVDAAVDGLERIREQLRAVLQEILSRRQSMPRQLVNELRSSAKRLGRYARLKQAPIARMVLLIFREALIRRWIPSDWGRRIERDLDTINRARRFQHEQRIIERKLKVLELLQGNRQRVGELEQELLQLDQLRRDRRSLRELVTPDIREIEPSCSTELLVVSSVDQIINRETGETFEEMAFRRLERVRCTPERLAGQLRQQGLLVSGHRYRPHEFSSCDVAAVKEALITEAERFLGITDEEWHANPENPKTGLDMLAGLSLMSPELRSRTEELSGALVTHSTPYAQIRTLGDSETLQESFLYCHPSERPAWLRLLRGQVTITEPQNAGAYSLYGPYRVLLVQKTLIAPIGNLRAAWKWSAASNRVRRSGLVQPLIHCDRLIDFRRLDRREKDHGDCVQFFEAGLAAGRIFEVGTSGDCFAFNGTDQETKWFFSEMTVSPRWLVAKDFHQLTGESLFVKELQKLFQELPTLAAVCDRLNNEDDASVVMSRLVSMGICARESGRFRLTRSPERLRDPWLSRIFEVTLGDQKGLSRESFVSKLQDDDTLYNALHWKLFDASLQGHINRNETPDSVARLIEEVSR